MNRPDLKATPISKMCEDCKDKSKDKEEEKKGEEMKKEWEDMNEEEKEQYVLINFRK